ncbi:hypothetical protein AB4Z54_04280 [Streptomyces sp. MCAF7]
MATTASSGSSLSHSARSGAGSGPSTSGAAAITVAMARVRVSGGAGGSRRRVASGRPARSPTTVKVFAVNSAVAVRVTSTSEGSDPRSGR